MRLQPRRRQGALGQRCEAVGIPFEGCHAGPRGLDAQAHLGKFEFDHVSALAGRPHEVGLRIGELSLGNGINGVLPWSLIDDRLFLRCMHGFGLCCWRLGRFEEAERVFGRVLWLNPYDDQGVRFLVDAVRNGSACRISRRRGYKSACLNTFARW